MLPWIAATVVVWIIASNHGFDRPLSLLNDLLGRAAPRNSVSDGTLLDGTAFHYSAQGDRHRFDFTPHLSRDDSTIRTAIVELIGAAFGPRAIRNFTPQVASRGGANVLVYDGGQRWLLASTMKAADTGRVYAASLWAEPK